MLSHCLIFIGSLLVLPAAWGYFEGCDNTYTVDGTIYVESPYYNSTYPPGTSCRYKFVAPVDYYITVQCTISLPSNNGQCSTDNFWLDTEGDLLMRTSENFCGTGTFTRDSLFTELVFAYISTGSNVGGKFRCSLSAKPQSCNCGWSATTRIANGQAAAANEYPSMAALKDTTSNVAIFCGATIVSHRHLVTAAHCTNQVSRATNIVAIVGTNSIQNPSSSIYYAQYAIQQMVQHEQYVNNPSVENDIAVLTTATSIKWTRGVGPICLPPQGTSATFSYDTVDVIGYGMTSFGGYLSATLQKINLMVVNNVDCQTDYNGVATINSGQICTYDYTGNSRDSCQFDSGGPVIKRSAKQFLLGIVSFGKNCGNAAYSMGVNTRVTSYISWIRQKIGYSNCIVSM
ncbi:venom serine protease [Drosophila sulfurigaster albostrigata]|uniref:venom serine protease n=1 Tax=Drosophila sulfurigaster albostrigata TaxID=89887 RepID=UPI002D219621|nr:venom serine protease [Drosophila sulfurigaster albostrigata]